MHSHKIKGIAAAILIVIVMGSIFLFDLKIKASVLEIAKAKVQVDETEKINRIVNQEVVAKNSYDDLVYIHKDKNGRIVLIQPNTIVLNKIMANTTTRITESLGQMEEESIAIPLGQVSGSVLLSGYGPKILVKVIPSGQVDVDILNKFDEAGVNQTRHLIYCKIKARIKIAVPLMNEEIKVSTTIPLAETIIVGDVPRTYVNYKENQSIPYPYINEE